LLMEEERDELGEAITQSEDERGHEYQDEEHDRRVVNDLRARRPGDLAHLFAHFAQEGRGTGALGLAPLDVLNRGGATRGGGAVGAHLALSLHHALLFAVHLTSLVGTTVRS